MSDYSVYDSVMGIAPSTPKGTDSTAIQNGSAPPTGATYEWNKATDRPVPGDRYVKTDGSYKDQASLKNLPIAPEAPSNPYAIYDQVMSSPVAKQGPAATQTVQRPQSAISSPEFDMTAHVASSMGGAIAGGYAGLVKGAGTLLTGGGFEQAARDAAETSDKTRNALTFQPRTDRGAGMVGEFQSNANPLAWIPNGAAYLGEKAGGALADLGMPGAGAVVNGAINAAPVALGMRGGRRLADLKSSEAPVPIRVEPTMDGAALPRPTLPAPGEPAAMVPQQLPTQGQPAVQTAPYKPFPAPQAVAAPKPVPTTPEAVQAIAQSAPAELFPETPTVSPQGKFGAQEQRARAQILESVGIDQNKLRKSALAGDAIGGSTDFQTAKVDSPAGREMRSIIEGEKQALTNHADTLVRDTGGTRGTDGSALYARGNTIVSALDGLKEWYDSRIQQLYKTADERAPGVPTQLEGFRSVLGDDSHMTNNDRVHLRDAINAYAKKLNIMKDDGTVFSNGQQAETMRKYLNENWSPSNGKYVSKLKDALDDDIMKAAGEDVYAEARQMRADRGRTLDNPNGIAKLMDSSGPDGINRSVAQEKIPDHLTGMSVDQFSHVIDTLRNAPPEVQPRATAALNEIKAQFANKVENIGSAQQGQWNAKGVTKYLQDNAARMSRVFTPQEIQAFRNLNDAGHIVAKDQSYPGAAVQGHNLVTQGLMHGLPAAGAGIGATIGGPVGGVIGAGAGRMAAGAMDNAVGLRAVKKRTTRLADLPN